MTCQHDENNLFQQAMGDVTPLKTCGSTLWLPVPPLRPARDRQQELQLDNPLSTGLLEIVPCTTELAWQTAGLQQGVADKLYLGKYAPQATIDLRQVSVEQCRQRLYLFICRAQQENWRNLLIVHGKGRHDQSHANIVRSYLLRWLPQFESVQAFCAARPQDGGSGACYVGLRKSEQARQQNRERHAKRSR